MNKDNNFKTKKLALCAMLGLGAMTNPGMAYASCNGTIGGFSAKTYAIGVTGDLAGMVPVPGGSVFVKNVLGTLFGFGGTTITPTDVWNMVSCHAEAQISIQIDDFHGKDLKADNIAFGEQFEKLEDKFTTAPIATVQAELDNLIWDADRNADKMEAWITQVDESKKHLVLPHYATLASTHLGLLNVRMSTVTTDDPLYLYYLDSYNNAVLEHKDVVFDNIDAAITQRESQIVWGIDSNSNPLDGVVNDHVSGQVSCASYSGLNRTVSFGMPFNYNLENMDLYIYDTAKSLSPLYQKDMLGYMGKSPLDFLNQFYINGVDGAIDDWADHCRQANNQLKAQVTSEYLVDIQNYYNYNVVDVAHAWTVKGPRAPDVTEYTFKWTGASGDVCLTAQGAQNLDNISLQLCNGANEQKWIHDNGLLRLKTNPARCLDIDGWNNTAGTNVILWDCHGGTNQLWQIQQDGPSCQVSINSLLQEQQGGTLTIDRFNWGDSPGTNLVVWHKSTVGPQSWTVAGVNIPSCQ